MKKFDEFINENNETEKEVEKIEVVCCDCGKKFKTTKDWFDKKNKDGKLPCRKCRFSKFPPKKEKPTEPDKKNND
jgi:DNA-directed RNA polymerase subunit RPC12/RpoP